MAIFYMFINIKDDNLEVETNLNCLHENHKRT